jgi:multidrug efflux system membrane fusion protein
MDDRTVTDYTRTQPVTYPFQTPAAWRPVVRKNRRGFGILTLLILSAAAGYWLYTQRLSASAPAPGRRADFAQGMPVVAMPAVKGDIDITLNALGTVTSLATVTIKSQISGQLVRVAYKEGQLVERGDLLAEIDSRPYEIALQQAQGTLERDQAMLQSAELDLNRYQLLASTNAIARQQLDQQVGLVGQYKGNLISDQAQIDNAKLNIAYCHVVAPVSGRIGLRLVDQGNYVTPGDAIVVIAQLKPISVIFTVAEDNLPEIKKRLNTVETLPVTVFNRSGHIQLATGKLRTLDNQIDTATGTVKLRADFSNEEDNLFPNQFVNVTLLIDQLHDTTVIPTAAIQRGVPGTFMYLVNADNSVTVRPVTLGPTSGDRVAVAAGLSAGDRVVVDGADKLRDGAKVSLRAPANGGASSAPAVGSAEPPWYRPVRGGLPDRPNAGSRRGRRAL